MLTDASGKSLTPPSYVFGSPVQLCKKASYPEGVWIGGQKWYEQVGALVSLASKLSHRDSDYVRKSLVIIRSASRCAHSVTQAVTLQWNRSGTGDKAWMISRSTLSSVFPCLPQMPHCWLWLNQISHGLPVSMGFGCSKVWWWIHPRWPCRLASVSLSHPQSGPQESLPVHDYTQSLTPHLCETTFSFSPYP